MGQGGRDGAAKAVLAGPEHLQVGEAAELGRYVAAEAVLVEVEVLEAEEVAKVGWYGTA